MSFKCNSFVVAVYKPEKYTPSIYVQEHFKEVANVASTDGIETYVASYYVATKYKVAQIRGPQIQGPKIRGPQK